MTTKTATFDELSIKSDFAAYAGEEGYLEYRTYIISDELGTGDWDIIDETEASLTVEYTEYEDWEFV